VAHYMLLIEGGHNTRQRTIKRQQVWRFS